MRPHNSGHWTQDGAVTSQFEQHLRAVLDLPLGDPQPARGVVGHGQHPRRPGRGHARRALRRGDGGASRRRRSTPTARRPGPGARSGTSTSAGDDLDDVAYQARAAASFFRTDPEATRARRCGDLPAAPLAWTGDSATAFLRRAPRRRRHGLRLRLARDERRLAGAHRLRDRRTRSRSSRRTARPTSSCATGARRAPAASG